MHFSEPEELVTRLKATIFKTSYYAEVIKHLPILEYTVKFYDRVMVVIFIYCKKLFCRVEAALLTGLNNDY